MVKKCLLVCLLFAASPLSCLEPEEETDGDADSDSDGDGDGDADDDPPLTTATPAGGLYDTPIEVSLECDDGDGSGCEATYFTNDGSDPTTESAQYTGPLTIADTTTLKFFSVDVAGNEEPIRTESYVFGGELAPWGCEPPAPPSPDGDVYHHMRWDIPYPDDENPWEADMMFSSWLRPMMSENGSRVALAVNLNRTDLGPFEAGSVHHGLYLFDANNPGPIWHQDLSPSGASFALNVIYSLDMTRDGRGLVAVQGSRIMLFACDQPEPLWVYDASETGVGSGIDDVHFAPDGDYVVATTQVTMGDDMEMDGMVRHVLVFRRDLNVPIRDIVVRSVSPVVADISGDGSRVAIMTENEHPDDLEGERHSVEREIYDHARVMVYENGEHLWTEWVMHECTDCTEYGLDFLVGPSQVRISADGSTVVAAGPGGKLVRMNADSGSEIWTYEETWQIWDSSPDRSPYYVVDINISDDGEQVSALSALAGETNRGVLYFDESSQGEPLWASEDQVRLYVDWSEDRAPSPHGFDQLYEYEYDGFGETPGIGPLRPPDHLRNLEMSADGNVLSVCGYGDTRYDNDEEYGHIFALYRGSPVPFASMAEDEPNGDSDFIQSRLSADGAWIAGFSYDEDEHEDHDRPRMSLHLYEIPPGIIMDVLTMVTLSLHGTTGEIVEWLSVSDEVHVDHHVVKPGRAAMLVEELRLTTMMEEMFFDLCIPWQTTQNREYDFPDGFHAEQTELEWSTPMCLFNAIGFMDMVLRDELFGAEGTMYDQEYDDYMSFSWVTPDPP
jgi:outer membrane protein assembly factor BamB